MPTILTCTDGSRYAASVYDHSAWAAGKLNASIHVLHMLEPKNDKPVLADLSGSIGPDAYAALLDELVDLEQAKARVAQTKGKAILSEALRHLEASNAQNVKIEQLHGTLVDAIEEYDDEVELVVIGKRGETADFAKLHLGANLERVIRTSRKPVLVASRTYNPIDNFLLAYDGSNSAKKALSYATSNPLLKGLKCHLLTAGSSDSAKKELAHAESVLATAGFEVSAECIAGDAEQIISEQVKARNIKLLVMGAYGHSRIRQLIVGSTTTTMVRTCQVPVLMFK